MADIEVIEVLEEGPQGPKGTDGADGVMLPAKSGYLGGSLPVLARTSANSISVGGGTFSFIDHSKLPQLHVEEKVFLGVPNHTLNSIPPEVIVYIYLDLVSMTIVESQVVPSAKHPNWAYLGNVDYDAGDIEVNSVIETSYSSVGATSLMLSHGDYNLSGCVYSGNTGLTLSHTEGLGVRIGINTRNNLSDPDRVVTQENAISFVARAYTNSAGDLVINRDPTQIDPTQFSKDRVLSSVGQNKWTVQYLYHFYGSDVAFVYYGDKEYTNKEDAISSITMPPRRIHAIVREASLRAAIVVRGGATELTDPLDAEIVGM